MAHDLKICPISTETPDKAVLSPKPDEVTSDSLNPDKLCKTNSRFDFPSFEERTLDVISYGN